MIKPVLLDTGPLVAFLNRHDDAHDWAVARFNLETAVNAKAQRRKDAERKELGWVAKLNWVHRAVSVEAEPTKLVPFAALRLCAFALNFNCRS